MSVLDPVIDHLDPATKRIYLKTGAREYHPIDDLYHEVRYLRRTDETLQKYLNPVTGGGAVPKGSGKYTPRYAILQHGWRVIPEDVNHTLSITGEQLTDEGGSGPDCMDTTGLTASIIIMYEPPAAEIVQLTNTLIEYASFNGGVYIDTSSPYSGTAFPTGTMQQPVNNLTDAQAIAAGRGFNTFYVSGSLTVNSGDHSGHTFIGESPVSTSIAAGAAADFTGVELVDMIVTGTLNGDCRLITCYLIGVDFGAGSISLERCALTGVFDLGGATNVTLVGCSTLEPAMPPATFDLGAMDGPLLISQGFNGKIILTDRSAAIDVNIDLASGLVEVDSTVSAGTVTVRGVGRVVDNSTGTATVVNNLVSPDDISLIRKVLQNRTYTDPATGVMSVYDDNDVDVLLTANLYEDVAGLTMYGEDSARIDRRNKLAAPG